MPGARHLLAVAPRVAAIAGLLSASACMTGAGSDDADRILPYVCGDVVVRGRIQNGAYRPLETEGDLIGHGSVDAVIIVDKQIKGPPALHRLAVIYTAHVMLRDDTDYLFVLKPAPNGRYELRTAQVMELHPRLASRCDQTG